MCVRNNRSLGFASAFLAALLLALMPAGGHALSLCLCADGDVSLEAECQPVSCCDDSHGDEAPVEVPESSECTEVPLLPDSELQISASTAAPRLPVTSSAVLTPEYTTRASTLELRQHFRPPSSIPLANRWEALRSTVILV